jgi:hypothetical protein
MLFVRRLAEMPALGKRTGVGLVVGALAIPTCVRSILRRMSGVDAAEKEEK